MLHQSSNMCN